MTVMTDITIRSRTDFNDLNPVVLFRKKKGFDFFFFNFYLIEVVWNLIFATLTIYAFSVFSFDCNHWYIYIYIIIIYIKLYIFIQQFFLVLESERLIRVWYSSDIGTPTVSLFLSLRLRYSSQWVSWRTAKSTIIL